MLNTTVGITGSATVSPSNYSFSLFFEDNLKAAYLRVGDVVSTTQGNRYSIDSWTGFPNDFGSGQTCFVSPVDADEQPTDDGGFTSSLATPGQENLESELVLGGAIGSASLVSGQNFEYQLAASWDDPILATELVVGDKIVDNAGKEFEITFIDPSGFSAPFRMKESEPVGTPPQSGNATAYRPSDNFDLFQGNTAIPPDALNRIRNRDSNIIDQNLGQGGGGSGSVNGEYQKYEIDLTSAILSAKQLTLSPTPLDDAEVTIVALSLGELDQDTHYTISNGVVSWGQVLEELFDTDTTLRVSYFS